MSNSASPLQTGERACPRCGQKFTCGLAAAHERCWCFDQPHIIPVQEVSREGCLCPACLGKLIESIQSRQARTS